MKDAKELLKQRDLLLDKLCKTPLWISGSVVESVRKYQGKETPFYYLSQSVAGKNIITYISAKDLKKFKVAAASGQALKKLLNKLSSVNIKLLKVGDYNDK
jgi:hypothetical protein